MYYLIDDKNIFLTVIAFHDVLHSWHEQCNYTACVGVSLMNAENVLVRVEV